jgi:Zn-dependent protease with chaperone function
MKMKCPHCNQPLESQEDLSGRTVQCPSCNRDFTAPLSQSVRVARAQPAINLSALRDPKEGAAFGWLVFFSLILWLFIAIWIVSSFGVGLIIIGLIALIRRMIEMFAAAYIKTNAVEVSDRQFPEIHGIAASFAAHVGKPLPTIYVMQQNVWNALAMKIAGKRLVVLFSGAVDSLLLKGSITQLGWLVGHELGHHYAGHLNFWRHTTAQLGSWFVWVGLWYKRRCELTCDRYGLACAGSLPESLRAVCNMAVGGQLAGDVDVDQAIEQWNRHRSEFFVKYRTIYSTHPHTLWRLEELKKAGGEMGIQ